jgi:hypothetical protein
VLPCGECALCRQGGVSACSRSTTPLVGRPLGAEIDIVDRFVYSLPEDADVRSGLPVEVLLCAPAVALILDATARASLGPSDHAIWVGDSDWFRAGAIHSAALGRTSLIASPSLAHDAPERLIRVSAGSAGEVSPATVMRNLPPAGGQASSDHGQRTRRIFVSADDPAAIALALAVSEPGATLALLGPARAAIPPPTKLKMGRLLLIEGYHPDFIPEAFATLRSSAMEPLRARLLAMVTPRIARA